MRHFMAQRRDGTTTELPDILTDIIRPLIPFCEELLEKKGLHVGRLYAGKPLTEDKSIRLLELLPNRHLRAALQARLLVISLDNPPQYVALSYTWQPPFENQVLPDSIIWLEDVPLRITGNLDHALRRLRRTTESKLLWVDAICINQRNDEERTRQVAEMASIYAAANYVFAWLGEDSGLHDGCLVIGWHSNQESLRKSQLKYLASMGLAGWQMQHNLSNRGIVEALSQDYEEARDDAPALSRFACRRYFRRRWVVQELGCARKIRVGCGIWSVSWQSFKQAMDYLSSVECLEYAPMRPFRQLVQAFEDCRKHYWDGKETDDDLKRSWDNHIVDAMIDFRNFQCGDDRDRLASLLNLFHTAGFTIDYNRTCEEIYVDFARHYAVDYDPFITGFLLQIAAGQAEKGLRRVGELPSWVVDWRVPVSPLSAGLSRDSRRSQLHANTSRYRPKSGDDKLMLEANVSLYGVIGEDLPKWKVISCTFELMPGDKICGPSWRVSMSRQETDELWSQPLPRPIKPMLGPPLSPAMLEEGVRADFINFFQPSRVDISHEGKSHVFVFRSAGEGKVRLMGTCIVPTEIAPNGVWDLVSGGRRVDLIIV